MTFKMPDQILQADSRFADMSVVDHAGVRAMTLNDHHATIATIELAGTPPPEVGAAFDRARNVLLYAWFDYDLLVVGEAQAFAAFELALRQSLAAFPVAKPGTLRNLVDRARKHGVLGAPTAHPSGLLDPVEAIIHLRNALAHGSTDVHTPAIALDLLQACAEEIDLLYPPP